MAQRHTLYYHQELAAEQALVIVRSHMSMGAGLLIPIGTAYAHSVVFDTNKPLLPQTEELLIQRAQPDAINFNEDLEVF